MDYDDALRWLHTLPDFERTGEFAERPDLAPMRALLAALGDPHLGRTTVHVAGSKGKGSTAAMAEAMLRAGGATTGFYSSPHLHRYTERIRIDGKPVEPEVFGNAMERVRAAMDGVAPQFPDRRLLAFDALTAAGFLAFADASVDVQVVEVGLGGTLDSTNVFDATDVVVITPVGLEHTAVLGDTIPAIAAQKAGIITPGATVVVSPQRESAIDVVRDVAGERGADVIEVAKVCQLTRTRAAADAQEFKLKTPHGTYTARLPLAGRHQLDNATTAVVACEELARRRGAELKPEHVREGLAGVSWPGRLEVLKRRPWVVVDGAHNGDSAKRLATALGEYFGLTRVTLLFGTLAGKDINAMAEAMAPVAERVFATGWPHARAESPDALARAFVPSEVPATVFTSLPRAFDAALADAGEGGAVVAFGSIAFVASVREYLLGIESDMIKLARESSRGGKS